MKNDGSVMRNIFKKVSYSAGFICAKVSKVKNIGDNESGKNAFSGMKSFFIKVGEEAKGFFEKTKDHSPRIKESFKNGFESIRGQIDGKKGQESEPMGIKHDSGVKRAASINEGKKVRPKAKAAAKDIEKNESEQARQRIKEFPEEILDAELEKEIEQITKEVAEI